MIELLIAVLICVVLDLILMVRVLNGPSAADRLCASDALTLVTVFGLVLFLCIPAESSTWTSHWWMRPWVSSARSSCPVIWRADYEYDNACDY